VISVVSNHFLSVGEVVLLFLFLVLLVILSVLQGLDPLVGLVVCTMVGPDFVPVLFSVGTNVRDYLDLVKLVGIDPALLEPLEVLLTI
jgi:hypothetical protein